MTQLGAIAFLALAIALPTAWPSPGATSFLVVDLAGDGVYLTDLSYGIPFDLDGDGAEETTAWTVQDGDDAFLWLDTDGDGRVTDGSELVRGDPMAVGDTLPASAFDALAALDHPDRGGDGDRRLSPADRGWSELRLWRDADRDGRSSPAEITTLDAVGLLSIGLEPARILRVEGSLNRIWGSAEALRSPEPPARVFEIEPILGTR